jgi:hypothetical protein
MKDQKVEWNNPDICQEFLINRDTFLTGRRNIRALMKVTIQELRSYVREVDNNHVVS